MKIKLICALGLFAFAANAAEIAQPVDMEECKKQDAQMPSELRHFLTRNIKQDPRAFEVWLGALYVATHLQAEEDIWKAAEACLDADEIGSEVGCSDACKEFEMSWQIYVANNGYPPIRLDIFKTKN